jgi:hypothetical protein
MKTTFVYGFLMLLLGAQALFGMENLKLNATLDYQSDSLDGPLITGDDTQSGLRPRQDQLCHHLR